MTPYIIENGKLRVNKAWYNENKADLDAKAKEKGFPSGVEYLASQIGNKYGGEINPKPLQWTDKQLSKAAGIAQENGLSLKEFLMIVRQEAGPSMNPASRNTQGGSATGIIQLLDSTAADLLLQEQRAAAINSATTPEAKAKAKKDNPRWGDLTPAQQVKARDWAQKSVANLPLDRQLDLTALYLSQRTKGKKGLENVYSAIFSGGPSGKAFLKGSRDYAANAYLDENKDGVLTREEWTKKIYNHEKAIDGFLMGKEVKPDMRVAQRTKAIREASVAAQQTPANIPDQTKARPATAEEAFGSPANVNLKYIGEILSQQAAPQEAVAPIKMPQLQQSKPQEEFRPNIIDSYSNPKEDELDLAGLYG
jgi:hypothetical protein